MHQATCDALLVALVEVQRPEVAVLGLVGQQAVGDDQDRVADCNQGFLLAASSGQAVILRSQVTAAFAAGCLMWRALTSSSSKLPSSRL